MKRLVIFLVTIILAPTTLLAANSDSAYLFVYFTGNRKSEEAVRYAISTDGYRFRSLHNNEPVISSAVISSTGGVRDPHILRGQDGKTFYMVVTDMVSANGWNSNRAMVLLKSTDLINWKSAVVNIQQRFSGNDSLLRVWAPQTIYDKKAGKYMVYWSMKHGQDADKIYYAYANNDFTDLVTEPKQLYFSPNNGACIDGDIVEKDNRYYLFFKTEDGHPGIRVAVSDSVNGGYQLRPGEVQQTQNPVEGSGVFKLNNNEGYILMYDMYTTGKYQFTKSKDLQHFEVVDKEVSMDFQPRHGTVMPITATELSRLVSKYATAAGFMGTIHDPGIRKLNITMDTLQRTVQVMVKPGTDLKRMQPMFQLVPGVSITRIGKSDFSKGAVDYKVSIKGRPAETWSVKAVANNNTVLDGFYADPDVLYSAKTGKYYIYPTSDGFAGWSGTYFKCFSSPDLVTWKDEGKVLDLETDVTWAHGKAWAPCIIERKEGGAYKYYYYYTGEQKIGLAIGDDPKGPFKDIGYPLIDKHPAGVNRGQEIDPEVFHDPVSNKYFLYWGNGYMAAAELSDDMRSLKEGTLQLITPDKTFREGTTVFYRNGKYYFLWSENDTRSEDYRVRYGTADSPLGPIHVPANNMVIAKDTVAGIYGTGHNSIIQVSGKDEWYIVYHRFNYPNGIHWGRAAGYSREVCIDRMYFNEDGSIREVVPTHKGITR
ncbi:family 43 glycosylhydrolase [Chitinophaga sp. sic0106]|uniref:family 43 glycosylhydrolase n=1 Tax=Chitinophaga sp. sic0106 TaxID=2854785 RepID=UPI0021055855|nr:family 43 glycosylhydrolase [Chitinophaga sp. sic0106]